ncbi:tetratricopeptide repeat protein [Chloroflexus sp.]|uniref:tetratricopeptide repeat protein n=1 Tax=Chloroflexus sp. TaxID=1904827 RepID=UPI003C71809F
MATISLQDAYTQARTFLEANQIEQAIGLTQHILTYHPDNLEAQRILGEAYLAQRDLSAAIATFEQVLQADPENIPAHVGLGMAYEWQGRLDKAIAEFEQALEIRPDMPELRAQLVRLYTEAWGSEHAALRLSRSGLARLYARGYMLPQAINEFKHFIAEHPERLDAWVGLIEALWRHSQLDEAAETCRKALQLSPHLLKAHLVLGTILLQKGDQSGIEHWRAAQRLDPYQTVASVLFEKLPVGVPIPDVSLPAWDEAEWRAKRAAAASPAATAPVDDFFADESWLTPAVQPAPVAAGVSDDDLLAMLLFSPPTTQVVESRPAVVGGDEFDAFNLSGAKVTPTGLTLDEIGVQVSEPSAEPELQPFSLADLGLSAEEIAQFEGTAAPSASAEPELKPFSLADLGLSAEEIAQLEGTAAPSTGGTLITDEFGDLQPFSLDDLDFGAGSTGEDLPPSLQPFSLDDLALDETATAPPLAESIEPGIYSWQAPSARSGGIQLPKEPEPSGPSIFSKLVERAASLPRAEEPSLSSVELTEADINAYFSSDDVSLREDDGSPERLTGTFRLPKVGLDESLVPSGAVSALTGKAEGSETAESEELLPFSLAEPELQPFSLEELGLSPEEIAQLEAAQRGEPAALPSERKTVPVVDEPIESLLTTGDAGDVFTSTVADSSIGLTDLEPFSFEEFGDLEPFSFEDLEGGTVEGGELAISPEEIDTLNIGNFETVVFSDDEEPMIDTGDPVLNRLIQLGHRQGYVDITDIIAVVQDPEREAERIEQIGWSLHRAGIQIRDGDEIIDMEAELGEEDTSAMPVADADLTPFAEELPSAVLEADLTPFAEKLPSTPPAEPELQPFSLEELGLSPEEIAQLEAAQRGEPATPAEPELQPFSLEELGLSPEEIAQLEAAQRGEPAAPAEPELQPFSLEELGLSPEEIAQLEAAQRGEPAALPSERKTVPVVDEPIESLLTTGDAGDVFTSTVADSSIGLTDLEPFSFEEFGDLEPFSFEDLEGGTVEGGELAISPEEIDTLNIGNFETVVFSDDEEPMIDTGDPVLNRLIQLGHRQGYVDITDIIAVVQDPEREAERIEQIGWSLHRAGIQIRDGDEIIDMEAELGEEDTSAMPVADADLTPFAEELPSAVLEADLTPFAEKLPSTPPAEPELQPFSLEELGLSPEEIAQLEAAQRGEPATPAEPELQPFSLEELGLSPEEIAQLEAAQRSTQSEQPAETTAEDDLFDFSIAETVSVAKVVRTAPRVEEPQPVPKPEDMGFVPEPLDALDDIWQAPPEPTMPEPARVVLPPLSERPKPQPVARAVSAEERRSVTPTRDDLRFARREAASSGRGRSARAPLRPRAPEDFIPTGNAKLDEYLRQLSANPTNHALAFTIARLCAQTGQAELMAVVYRRLLKQHTLLERMAEELEDLINTVDDTTVLRHLHRLLGDVYSRQGRLDEAIAAYSVTFAE